MTQLWSDILFDPNAYYKLTNPKTYVNDLYTELDCYDEDHPTRLSIQQQISSLKPTNDATQEDIVNALRNLRNIKFPYQTVFITYEDMTLSSSPSDDEEDSIQRITKGFQNNPTVFTVIRWMYRSHISKLEIALVHDNRLFLFGSN